MHFETLLFVKAAGLGAVLILCYDLLIAFRRVLPHHPIAVAAEDLLFWLLAALMMFSGVYCTNQGILRSFLFLGMILGAVLCGNTVSPLFIRGATAILGIPVVFVKISTKRLLFLVRRCRIYRYKFAIYADQKKKARVLRMKRSKQVEKFKKRKGQQNIE